MARKAQKKAYAVRLNKDPIGRTQIAILRMAGFSSQKIAELTGRHERTINQELTRPEHKQIFHAYVASVGKEELPEEEWEVVEKALKQEGVIEVVETVNKRKKS